ncbi:VOC family protein [Methylomonas sp. AM2-LC]|uniref:VOC family protein n=1 Tax=Methylomonas sp. AM2-LC TaxID=3153301 RepID=UPI003262CCDA
MQNNPIAWFEIYVQDLERAKKFYEHVFDITLQPLSPPFPGIELLAFPADMNQYGATGALVKMQGHTPTGNSTLVYFKCTDCAVEQALVSQYGGQVQREKMSIGDYGYIALVSDTEGNMIGLHSM